MPEWSVATSLASHRPHLVYVDGWQQAVKGTREYHCGQPHRE